MPSLEKPPVPPQPSSPGVFPCVKPDRYDEKSLLCRACPRRRPGGGLEIADPLLPCAKGGDRRRGWLVGGPGCGPIAFRFLGDSPN